MKNIKKNINKDLFTEQILGGFTIPELMKFWECSRSVITSRKKEWNLIGISPNSKKRVLETNESGIFKYCSGCKDKLSLDKFYSNGTNNGKRKYKSKCIRCEKDERRDKIIQSIKDILFIQNRKYECELCGYNKNSAALVFHHHTDEKNFEISKSTTISKSILEHEISICKVLCANCHAEIHHPTLMLGSYGDDLVSIGY